MAPATLFGYLIDQAQLRHGQLGNQNRPKNPYQRRKRPRISNRGERFRVGVGSEGGI